MRGGEDTKDHIFALKSRPLQELLGLKEAELLGSGIYLLWPCYLTGSDCTTVDQSVHTSNGLE